MIVDVRISDLLNLIGRKLTLQELEENLFLLKCELERVVDDVATIEINPDRTDMLSAEGIARSLRGFLEIETGAPKYRVRPSKWQAIVDSSVRKIRPYLACGIVRGMSLTSDIIAELMQLQERLTSTFGRNRKRASIGLYALDLIKPPVYYRAQSPSTINFIPLESSEVMSAKQILRSHPKGQEFGGILEGYTHYPLLIDGDNQILSMPPVINSNDLGRIIETTENLFVEVTGTHRLTTIQSLNIMVSALAERGGRISSVETIYPDSAERLPDFSLQKRKVSLAYINNVIGYTLDGETVAHCLARMRMNCRAHGSSLHVSIPQYRVDILHDIDIVEDVAIGYGFNRIEPTLPSIMTVGRELPMTTFRRTIRDLMVGLGYQEIWNLVLTNKRFLFEKMNRPPVKIVEVSNPKSSEYQVLRNNLLPGLLSFLGENAAQELPQKVFETGDIVIAAPKAETCTHTIPSLAAATVNSRVDITKLKAELITLLQNLGLEARIKPTSNPSFIEGRVGTISISNQLVGILGEIHPIVLSNFGIEAPCVVFALDIDSNWLTESNT